MPGLITQQGYLLPFLLLFFFTATSGLHSVLPSLWWPAGIAGGGVKGVGAPPSSSADPVIDRPVASVVLAKGNGSGPWQLVPKTAVPNW